MAEANFKNEKLEGMCKTYYPNGELHYIDTYHDGQKINTKAYDEKGKLQSDQDCPSAK
jgi:antitoxin component YwqK of YwqJK toxin-antitoxin module